MTESAPATERELRAEIDINATPAKVWAILTDFANLADASPELVAMKPLLPGGLRLGQHYLGWNRRKSFFWPTLNTVITLEDEKTIAWDTIGSGARWIFELTPTTTGTRVVQRRPIPVGRAAIGRFVATYFLGGATSHDDELQAGMGQTLIHLKQLAEAPH